MRNKWCPIVAFQTGTNSDLCCPIRGQADPSAPRIPRSPSAIVTSFRTRAPIEAAYGKPRVNGLRVGCDMRLGETHSAPQHGDFCKAWVQTAAFLQQVQKTIELGLSRLWKCRVVLVS